jgi:hypothetical protein
MVTYFIVKNIIEIKMDGGMIVRVGAFLFGGLVGAAAVIYLNNKSKSMLLSAFSSNNTDLMNNSHAGKFATDANKSPGSPFAATAATSAFKKPDPTAAVGGVERVRNQLSETPELRVTVGEILASNNQSKEAQEVVQTH